MANQATWSYVQLQTKARRKHSPLSGPYSQLDVQLRTFDCKTPDDDAHERSVIMSGFEVAGLVLGGFPIVLGAAKAMQGRYANAKTWWRFEREFEDLIFAVEREHIAFSQILEILLDPIAGLSSEECETLQLNPSSLLWFEPRVQSELRQRVQAKYFGWFMRQLREIRDALDGLHDLLPIGKVR
jgi:hypothetical protein